MAPRDDRERFAYELAQELGVDYARIPASRSSERAVAEVQEGIQETMEVDPRRRRDPDEPDVTYGAAAGLSTLNRARPTSTRLALRDEDAFDDGRDT